MTRMRVAVAVAAVVALNACAPSAKQAGDSFPAQSRTSLSVDNNNWNNVNVYLVRGPIRTRLGSVIAMSKAEFNIPRAYVLGGSDLTVQVEPLGSNEAYVSPPIQVFPGARVALNVRNTLRHSNFAVYASN